MCLNQLRGVDFDDEELPFTEPNKTIHKVLPPSHTTHQQILNFYSKNQQVNEEFYHKLTSSMKAGVVGNCTFALQEISKPDIKAVRSALMATILRLGDVDTKADEAVEILVKTNKCTAISRPKSWKKYALREDDSGQTMVIEDDKNDQSKVVYAPLKMRTEYYVDRNSGNDKDADGDVKMEEGTVTLHGDEAQPKGEDEKKEDNLEKVEKEELVRGFKYGTTYVPCPDGQFNRLQTKKGIDICGFFYTKNVSFVLPISLYQTCRQIFSSAGIGQWEKSNIYGLILRLRNSKSLSHQLYRPCTKKVLWQLPAGCQKTVWIPRWGFSIQKFLKKSSVYYGPK